MVSPSQVNTTHETSPVHAPPPHETLTRLVGSVQYSHEPLSTDALSSKLSARGSIQPGNPQSPNKAVASAPAVKSSPKT